MNPKSMIYITILFSLLLSAYSQDINISVSDLMIYSKWRLSNKRVYLNDEEQIFRQVVFFENLKAINTHNSDPANTYTTGLNQFSDMTEEEFVSTFLNNKITSQKSFQSSSHEGFKASPSFQAAPSVDWRTKGAVTPVKSQGSCGSCWTYSSVALMESVNFIKNRVISNLSEQQLVDCVGAQYGYSSKGCSGGNPWEALDYATKFGVVDESQYPYVTKQGSCKVTSPTNGFKPKTVVRVSSTANDLKNALSQSPVAVVVDASKWGSYKSGVFNNCEAKMNHGVLAVGYDAQGNWIIKNSWGTGWGESGFMRISADKNCGILQFNFNITA